MVSNDTRTELEDTLGRVPSFIEAVADPAADHSWGIMRDLELAETELPVREKALVGLGAAVAIQCPYCVHFHRAESKMEGVSETGLEEAITVASTVRFFSTILHGAEIEMDDFVDETGKILEHVEEQQAAAGDD
jgi:AhpD family alkylhydroperoxidase